MVKNHIENTIYYSITTPHLLISIWLLGPRQLLDQEIGNFPIHALMAKGRIFTLQKMPFAKDLWSILWWWVRIAPLRWPRWWYYII